ncbi:hypothetical protein FACS1894130_08690 [Spirochaetia bacterium]|nr:hypothetical protein FACS1894130_08690 [Spirochaetia bacterium]
MIGTERESSLHRALKFQYAGAEGRTETLVGHYVCDGISEAGELIEVQTGSFGPLKQKIPALAAQGPIKIIHPIIVNKYIELFDEQGVLLSRRKSPRKGNPWDLFKALLYAPALPLTPNVTIELALVDTAERRVKDGCGSWRRRGVSIADKTLLAYRETITLLCREDYYRFVPFTKNEEFTVQDLRERAKIQSAIAQKALYVLAKMELVKRVGKKRNALVYRVRQGK